jgi:hypothetical protein
VADPEASVGEQTLDQARRLIALDRALLELGEPGLLERRPEELAVLQAELLGMEGATGDAGGSGSQPGPGRAPSPTGQGTRSLAPAPSPRRGGGAEEAGDGPSGGARGPLPGLRVLHGRGRGGTPAEQAQSLALRSQFRLLKGLKGQPAAPGEADVKGQRPV